MTHVQVYRNYTIVLLECHYECKSISFNFLYHFAEYVYAPVGYSYGV